MTRRRIRILYKSLFCYCPLCSDTSPTPPWNEYFTILSFIIWRWSKSGHIFGGTSVYSKNQKGVFHQLLPPADKLKLVRAYLCGLKSERRGGFIQKEIISQQNPKFTRWAWRSVLCSTGTQSQPPSATISTFWSVGQTRNTCRTPWLSNEARRGTPWHAILSRQEGRTSVP